MPLQMRDAIKDLEKVAGYILDLRSNPGGLLFSSVEMWLEKTALIVSTGRGEKKTLKSPTTTPTDKPLVSMVDGGSASASEILAGAFKDNNRCFSREQRPLVRAWCNRCEGWAMAPGWR